MSDLTNQNKHINLYSQSADQDVLERVHSSGPSKADCGPGKYNFGKTIPPSGTTDNCYYLGVRFEGWRLVIKKILWGYLAC